MTLARASASTLLAFLFTAAGCSNNKGTGATETQNTGGSTGTMSSSSGTGASSTSSSTGGSTTSSTSSSSSGTGGGTTTSKWPDTTATIGVLVDQLPGGMTAGQNMFVATHFVGSQKLTLNISGPIRAINPNFIVLHYHLAIWQSAVSFIIDGNNWGNDLSTVTTHESWFWHNQQNQRVTDPGDGKFLMNLNDPGFAAYWESSLEQQVAAGQYDGIFFDSASPSLLQGWVGAEDSRLAGTGARDTPIAEWGGMTYIQVWQTWISKLNGDLAAKGIPLIPNDSAFVTGWDNTDYSLTAGIFSEGYADPSFAESDWKAATDYLLGLVAKGKIVMLQNYLANDGDVATRLYYLGNYLLVKGNRTYLDYFAGNGPLSWYPEWGIDLGAPTNTGATVADLLQGGVYRRDFAKGTVLVNLSGSAVMVSLGASMKQVVPSGGGAVDNAGTTPGSITMMPVTSVSVPATGAVILLH